MPVVGIATVLVKPSFEGTQREIGREIDKTASTVGRSAGSKLGKSMADGFRDESKGLEAEVGRLEAEVTKSKDNVAAGSRRLADASAAEEKALGSLRVAELKLQETQDAGAAKASVLAAAEERVRSSRDRAAQATVKRESAERSLTKAHTDLDNVQKRSSAASENLASHLRNVGTESQNTERSVSRLGSTMQRMGALNPFRSMSDSVHRDSDRIGSDLLRMAQQASLFGSGGGKAVAGAALKITGGLSLIGPAAGAAGAGLVSAAGNVVTLASSLSSLGGVAALVPAGLISVGASAGVLATAFSGVGDALKTASDETAAFVQNPRIAAMAVEDATSAITQAEQNAAKVQVDGARRVADAKRSLQDTVGEVARAEQDAADASAEASRRVVSARRDLADAVEAAARVQQDAARTAEQAARRVADAERSLSDAVKAAARAERDAADAIVDAARRVRDAKLDLQDTIESVADAQKAAARAVSRAERQEANSVRDVTKAQKDLVEARAAAAAQVDVVEQRLSDAGFAATDAALAYQRAVAAYNNAQQDPGAGAGRLAQLQNNAEKARVANARAQQTVVDLRKEQAKAVADAKTGGAAVLEAEQRLADARQDQADATVDRQDAQKRVVKQQKDGARQVANAQETVADALKGQKDAQVSAADTAEQSARRVADAQRSVTDALDAQRSSQVDAARSAQDAARRVTDAQQGVSDAVKAEAAARAEAVRAGTEGARRVADAQRDVTDAVAESQQSQVDAARSVDQAYRNLERIQLQQADSAGKAGSKAKEAMDNLTPSAQEAVRTMLSLRDTFDSVRRIAQENFFTGLSAGAVSLVSSLLPQLQSGVGAIATAFNGSAKQLMGSLQSALGGGVLNALLQGTAAAITNLNKAIDPVVRSFVTLGVVGMQYMPRFTQWIADLATRFNNFIQAAATDGRLVAWIDAGIQGVKDLWSILGSVVGVFGDLSRAAAAGGAVSTLGGLAQGMRDLDEAMSGSTFQTTMSTIFSGAEKGAQGLLRGLGQIGEAFTRGAPALAEFLRLGGEIAGTFVGGVFTALSDPGFGSGLITFMGSLQRGASNAAPLMRGLVDAFGGVLTAVGPIVERLGPTLIQVFTGVARAVGGILTFLRPVLEMIAGSPVAIGLMIGAMATLSATIIGLKVVGGIINAWTVATKIQTGAQWLLNAAMKANPIGLIITGITLLVGALTWFFTQTEWGRNIVAAAWKGIQAAIGAVVTWWTNTAWPFIKVGIDAVAAGFRWFYESVIKPVWAGIKMVISAWWAGVQVIFNAVKWYITNILAPVYTWLWNNIVVPAFRGISAVIGWAWNSIVKPIFAALNGFVRNVVGPTVSWLWRSIVEPAFRGISGAIGTAWSWIRDHIFTPLNNWMRGTLGAAFNLLKQTATGAWEGLKNGVSGSWNWIRDNVFAPIQTAIKTTIPNAFDAGVKAITKFWDGLKSAAKAPVKFVVDKVINPWLIGTFNNIGKPFGLAHIDDIELPDGFARGGVLPGYQSRKRDDVLTPMRSGEGVLVPEAVRALGADSIHSINAAANSGGVAGARKLLSEGAAAGGPPGGPGGSGIWSALQSAANRAGYMYFPKRSFLGVDTENAAKAWIGQSALDIRIGDGSPGIKQYVPGGSGGWGFYSGDTIWMQPNGPKTSQQKIGTLAHEMGHALSLMHTPGTDSIMNPMMQGGYWPHAGDYATLRRVWGEPGAGVKRYTAADVGQDGGGGFNPFSFLLDKAAGLIKGQFPNGGWMVDSVAGGAKRTIQGAIDWVGSKVGGVTDGIGKIVGGAVSRAQVTAWMTEALVRKGEMNPGNLFSGVNRAFKESGGNPNAVNGWDVNAKNGDPSRGLMQVIGATFRQYKEPGFDNILDPVHNILASINYTRARYGSLQAGWNLPGGYALGGIVGQSRPSAPSGSMSAAPYLYDQGGVLPPGLSQVVNLTRQPEHIYTKGQSEALQSLAARGAGQAGGVHIGQVMLPQQATVRDLVDELAFQQRVAGRGGRR